MKLLLDQNLSLRLLNKLKAAAYPHSTQVRLVGLEQADDRVIWNYARDQGFTLVSKDADFHEFSTIYGHPPKVIWLRCGNKPNWYVLNLLLNHRNRIGDFIYDEETSCLEIY